MIAGATLILYASHLGPPPLLSVSEEAVVAQARSLAASGTDTAGRPLPLFFQVADEAWVQPQAVYASAALVVVGADGTGARLASAMTTTLSVVLMYLVGRRFLKREWLAVTVAALLALTPALFAFGRTATDAPYALPFILIWLLTLMTFLERPRMWLIAAAGFALGVGVYAQPAAPITMLLLVGLTIALLWEADHRRPPAAFALAAGFAVPLCAMAVWFAVHPDTYNDTMGRWAILKAHIRFPLDGLRASVNWITLGTRVSFYWGFFDPSWLFFTGPERAGVLRGAAPLLLPMAVLVPLGFSRVLKSAPPGSAWLLLGGLAIAPLAASTLGEAHNIGQTLTILPFVVLLAGHGLARLLDHDAPVGARAAAVILLTLSPVQFGYYWWGRLLG